MSAANSRTTSWCAPPAAVKRRITPHCSSRFHAVAEATALHEVSLFPGDPGKSPGCVKAKGGGAIAGAKIVEAPKGVPGSYSFEAMIPWSAFGEAARTRVGMRAALRYYDGDGRAIKTVIGTSTEVPPGDLPRLPIEAEQSLEDGLLKEKRSPHLRRTIASPTSPAMPCSSGSWSTIAILLVLGPHFREGKEYYFADLGST